MAGERTLPGLELTGFWDLGSDGWKPGMDQNLRLLSAVAGGNVQSRTTSLPGSPASLSMYIVPSGDSQGDNVAIWDGVLGSESWVYLTPKAGWTFYVIDESAHVFWDGSAWALLDGGDVASVVADGSASRTLALTDRNKIIEMTSGSANTVTIPAESSVNFSVGSLVNISQVGAGTTTIEGSAGVTLNGVSAGSCTIDGQWGGVALYKRAADEWVTQGAISGVT